MTGRRASSAMWLLGPAASTRLGLLEVGRFPDPLVEVAAYPVGVLLAGRHVPPPAEPAPDAAPRVAGRVRLAVLDGVEPALVPLEADPPDRVREIGVERGRAGDARPRGLLVRVPVLEDPEALRALAGLAVGARAPAGCAAGGIAGPVAER